MVSSHLLQRAFEFERTPCGPLACGPGCTCTALSFVLASLQCPWRLGPGAADAEKFDGEMFARFTVCVGFCCCGVVGVNAVVFVIEVTQMQLARICCTVLPTVM